MTGLWTRGVVRHARSSRLGMAAPHGWQPPPSPPSLAQRRACGRSGRRSCRPSGRPRGTCQSGPGGLERECGSWGARRRRRLAALIHARTRTRARAASPPAPRARRGPAPLPANAAGRRAHRQTCCAQVKRLSGGTSVQTSEGCGSYAKKASPPEACSASRRRAAGAGPAAAGGRHAGRGRGWGEGGEMGARSGAAARRPRCPDSASRAAAPAGCTRRPPAARAGAAAARHVARATRSAALRILAGAGGRGGHRARRRGGGTRGPGSCAGGASIKGEAEPKGSGGASNGDGASGGAEKGRVGPPSPNSTLVDGALIPAPGARPGPGDAFMQRPIASGDAEARVWGSARAARRPAARRRGAVRPVAPPVPAPHARSTPAPHPRSEL
jgi:hypothetical protein